MLGGHPGNGRYWGIALGDPGWGLTGILTSHSVAGAFRLGTLPSTEALEALGLRSLPEDSSDQQQQQQQQPVAAPNPFTAILPLLTALPLTREPKDTAKVKPSRYLVAKGLPTLPKKLVEKAWALQYVDMEEFLPAPRSLRLAELGKSTPSLQESKEATSGSLVMQRTYNIPCRCR